MTADEGRPERFGAIVDAALAAWAARWAIYLSLAALSIALEFAIDALVRFDPIAMAIVVPIVDGFPTAFVSIDVAARARGETVALDTLLRAALVRWPLVALVVVVTVLGQVLIFPAIFGSGEQTLYGVLILPGLVVLGVLGLPSVIASIDETTPRFALPGFAFVRSFVMASAWPNLGRLVIAGAMLAVPLMLEELLQKWLGTRGLPDGLAAFWANVPVDALQLAPFQAFFTYLYLDLLAREQKRG